MSKSKRLRANLPLVSMAAVILSGLVISILALYFVSQQRQARELDLRKDYGRRLADLRSRIETKSFAAVEAVFQDLLKGPINFRDTHDLQEQVKGIVLRHPVVQYPFVIDSRQEFLFPSLKEALPPRTKAPGWGDVNGRVLEIMINAARPYVYIVVARRFFNLLKLKALFTPNDDENHFYQELRKIEEWADFTNPGLMVREVPPFIVASKKMYGIDPGYGDISFGFSVSLDFIEKQIFSPLAKENLDDLSMKLRMNGKYRTGNDASYPYKLLSLPFQKIFPTLSLVLYANQAAYFENYVQREMWINYSLILVLILTLTVGIYLFFRYITREAELVKLKSEFLDNVSHTLKTPLTRISLLAENVQQGWVKAKSQKKEFFFAIISETARMNEMIDNMLNFSRIEAGKKQYELKETSLPQIVRAVVEQYTEYLEKLGFRLEIDIDDTLPPFLLDKEAIKLITVNLLQNAIKYSPDEKYLGIRLYGSDNHAVLEVEDRGIGIGKKTLPHIFERFFRAEDERVRNLEGSGLGLFLVHHAVKAHKGEIKITSQPGKGSVFTVYLPIKDSVRWAHNWNDEKDPVN